MTCVRVPSETRLELMRRMRGAGIPDIKIGQVWHISKQRIGQLLGPRSDLPDVIAKHQALVTRLNACLYTGESFADIARDLEVNRGHVSHIAYKLGITRATYLDARRQKARARLCSEIKTYLITGWPLTATYLQRYSNSLYTRALRVQAMEDWRRELGVADSTLFYTRLRKAKDAINNDQSVQRSARL